MVAAAVVATAAVSAATSAISAGSQSSGVAGAQAANAQTLAANTAAINNGVNTANGYLQPYDNSGTESLANLTAGVNNGTLNAPMTQAQYEASPLYTPMVNSLSDLQATPGYQFQLQQGLQSVNNSAAANGSLLSGATLQGINNYAQGQAATGYQAAWQRAQTAYQQAFNNNQSSQMQQYNQLQALANNGQNAANTMSGNTMNGAAMQVGSNTNYGNNAGTLSMAQGQIGANLATGIGNAVTSGIGGLSSGTPTTANTNLGAIGGSSGLSNSINSITSPSNFQSADLLALG